MSEFYHHGVEWVCCDCGAVYSWSWVTGIGPFCRCLGLLTYRGREKPEKQDEREGAE